MKVRQMLMRPKRGEMTEKSSMKLLKELFANLLDYDSSQKSEQCFECIQI